MSRVERFEDLEAWQRAREMTKAIYAMTSTGRFARDFVLRDQMRRAAVSIMGNVAEGFERGGNREFVQFLAVAKGSCGELRSYLYAALDQRYLPPAEHETAHQQVLLVSRLVGGLLRHLRRSDLRGSKYAQAGPP